jgi:hypothetical protein
MVLLSFGFELRHVKRGGGDFTPGGLEQIVMSDPWFTYLVSPMTEEFSPRARD